MLLKTIRILLFLTVMLVSCQSPLKSIDIEPFEKGTVWVVDTAIPHQISLRVLSSIGHKVRVKVESPDPYKAVCTLIDDWATVIEQKVGLCTLTFSDGTSENLMEGYGHIFLKDPPDYWFDYSITFDTIAN